MTEDFIQKLMISKQIMDRHKEMPRGNASDNINIPNNVELQSFNAPNAVYNVPEEFTSSSYSSPVNPPALTEDRIQKSKLPDEIKRLMIEHPISQPQQQAGGATLSDDLIERASRLMKNENSNNYIPESVKPKTQQPQTQSTSASQIDYKLIKKMIREAVDEALEENGLIVESSEKANEMLSFKVGKHVFEGKVTKIKKLV